MLFMLLFAIKRQNYSFFLYCQNLYITLCSKYPFTLFVRTHYAYYAGVANGVKHNSIYIQ